MRVNNSFCSGIDQPGNRSSGKPATLALDQIGTMLSPCSPRMSAETCRGGAFNFAAIRLRKRSVSNCVPRPMICDVGKSSRLAAKYVSTSTGLETTKRRIALATNFGYLAQNVDGSGRQAARAPAAGSPAYPGR